eukprot:6398042-Alexandrium_andersonii.AAC.1
MNRLALKQNSHTNQTVQCVAAIGSAPATMPSVGDWLPAIRVSSWSIPENRPKLPGAGQLLAASSFASRQSSCTRFRQRIR